MTVHVGSNSADTVAQVTRWPVPGPGGRTAVRSAVAALAVAACAALAPGHARAQVQMGIGGVDVGMSPDQVAAVISAQGQRVFSKSAKYVEAVLSDADTGAPVRARFLFEDEGRVRLKSVEFVEDDDKFVRQYLRWQSRLTRLYGAPLSRENTDTTQRDHQCHSRNVSVQLALFEQRAVLAYFYSPDISGDCQRAVPRRAFEPVAYDWRAPSERNPPPPQAAPPVVAAAPAPERPVAAGPSPLQYAPHRGQQYQDTLRCISVAAWNGSSGSAREQQYWRGVVQRASGDMVRLGRAEGLAPGQVDAEGRSIVARNHAAYQQGKQSGSTPYIDLDREFCRRRGHIPQ